MMLASPGQALPRHAVPFRAVPCLANCPTLYHTSPSTLSISTDVILHSSLQEYVSHWAWQSDTWIRLANCEQLL